MNAFLFVVMQSEMPLRSIVSKWSVDDVILLCALLAFRPNCSDPCGTLESNVLLGGGNPFFAAEGRPPSTVTWREHKDKIVSTSSTPKLRTEERSRVAQWFLKAKCWPYANWMKENIHIYCTKIYININVFYIFFKENDKY